MKRPEIPDALNRPLVAGAVGLVAGVLLVLLAALLVWPDDGATATDTVVVETPEVRPEPTLPTETPSTLETDDSASGEGGDEGDSGDSGDSGEENDDWPPSDAPPLRDVPPAGEGPLPDDSPVTCPGATVEVSSADGLVDALEDARPGDVIGLADGEYAGEFATTASGTEQDPVWLCGSEGAVLDGGDVDGGYTLHLDHASYWRLVGFTVAGGQKGVMADRTVGSVIQGLTVTGIGDEAIHLRDNSTDNVVAANSISDTGLRRDKFGEGVYVGTAVSNWCSYTDCQPDRSDRNVVKGNTMTDVSSEAVDIKEGTTGGVVVGNTFDGSGATGADSWVDVKGNSYLIAGNTGTNAEEDGFQTHQILPGWGDLNVFTGNDATVNGKGYAIASWPEESNVVRCDNTFAGAPEGLSNIPCT